MSEISSGNYRRKAAGRRKSSNIVDLRPKTRAERDSMINKLADRGPEAVETQLRGEREQKYRAEAERARTENKIKDAMPDLQKKMRDAQMRRGRKTY